MGALGLDFLTQVVNVNWGGLAVEFTERPDYLTMSNNDALSMKKAVISFWFLIPQQAIDAARRNYPPFYNGIAVMPGVIALLTFGPQQQGNMIEYRQVKIGEIPPAEGSTLPPHDVMADQPFVSGTAPTPSSYIGVICPKNFSSGSDPEPTLQVAIWTKDHANVSAVDWAATEAHFDPGGIQPIATTMTDVSSTVSNAEPEHWGDFQSTIIVTADKWHHLLISWDVTGSISTHGHHIDSETNEADVTSGGNHIWVALDDKNYTKFDLPFDWVDGSADPNLVLTHMGSVCAATHYQTGLTARFNITPDADGPAQYNYTASSIPSSPLGIPADKPQYNSADGAVKPIYNVAMAELQIFTGKTLNTSNEQNRRAFIDYERDEDGNPIVDKDGKRELKPVNPKQAEELLGQKPDILLHGTAKWQKGKNTGSIGIDTEGEEIPSGQFKPTGIIEKFKPDPIIEK